jgi:hypothetical protein
MPLLHKLETQHSCEQIGRPTTLGVGLGIVGLDQINQRFPRNHLLHLAQKSPAHGALRGRGLLVIDVGEALRKARTERLGAHEPRPCRRLHEYLA